MSTVGYQLSFYSSKFVTNLDLSTLPIARNYLVFALFLFFLGSAWIFIFKPAEIQLRNCRFNINLIVYVFVLIICAVIFVITYQAVGYIPLFHHDPGAKYFQDVNDAYLPYRPYYTLAINLCVASVIALIVLFSYAEGFQVKVKILVLILLFGSFILLTGKRGPILLPIAYVFFGMFLAGKIGLVRSGFFLAILIFLAGVLHFISGQQNDVIIGMVNSLSNSFFVGVRELGRFFSNFNDEFLYGMTYLAGITSFIPTELNDIKEQFLYPRYLIHLEGGNPNLSGGPRGTFIGEAYANFGFIGVVLVSWVFGFLYYHIFKIFLKPIYFRANEFVLGFFSAFILQQFILAFFENGSAFIFHFSSKYIFVFILVYSSMRIKSPTSSVIKT